MKKQKRFWTWTKKNKQKSRNKTSRSGYHNAPKDYRKSFNRAEKAQAKRALYVEINGGIGNFPPRTHRGQAAWCYW